MKLIVGLGNPGPKYERTRHNVGFVVADKLAGEGEWKGIKAMNGWICYGDETILLKPTTFMNESGQAVMAIMKKHQELTLDDLIVIHDDLDIELGKYKIQLGKGPQLHYGVESIENHLHTKDFWRVRIGVENRTVKGNSVISGEQFSLQEFTHRESKLLEPVIAEIVDKLVGVIS